MAFPLINYLQTPFYTFFTITVKIKDKNSTNNKL